MSRNLDLNRRAATHALCAIRSRVRDAKAVGHFVARYIVANGQSIAIRAAVRRTNPVAIHHPKKVYHYRYPQWSWGLHVHGTRPDTPYFHPDYWALYAYDEARAYHTCYVVPASVIGERQLSVHLQDIHQHRHGRSRIRDYERAWHLIGA